MSVRRSDGKNGDAGNSAWQLGTTTLSLEVPYRYRGGKADRPLVVGLHGWSESESITARRFSRLEALDARLLWPRAPYPLEARRGSRTRIGYGWYQYDGNRSRFNASLDAAAAFLLELIDSVGVTPPPTGSGAVLIGFSQGAYLAYYVALRHPERFRGAVGIAGRAVHELVTDLPRAKHVRLLHVHGIDDTIVSPEPCEASMAELAELGFDASSRRFPGGHDVSDEMMEEIESWLQPFMSRGE